MGSKAVPMAEDFVAKLPTREQAPAGARYGKKHPIL